MRGENELLEVIASLYDAASDIVPWGVALARLAGCLDSRAATLFGFDPQERRIVWLETSDPALNGASREAAEFEAALSVAPSPGAGRAETCAIAAPLRPWRRISACASSGPGACSPVAFEIGSAEIGSAMVGGLTLHGPPAHARGGERRLALLVPHLRQALQVHWRHHAAVEQREAELKALNRLPQGLILLDGRGEIAWRNHAAEVVLAEKDGLLEIQGHLRAMRSAEDRELQGRIAAAAGCARLGERGAFSITRSSPRRPIWLGLVALREPHGSLTGDVRSDSSVPALMVLISDPERSVEVPAEYLRQAYGLSPAEARLAASLARGAQLNESAGSFGITTGTARSQLKAIFAKTGTHSQAGLVRLLVSGLGVLWPEQQRSALASAGKSVIP